MRSLKNEKWVMKIFSVIYPFSEIHHEAMENKMHHHFWLIAHPGPLALAGMALLLVAWPMENVPALVVAGSMMVVAAGIAMRAHFLAREA
jgi:hypothetical protein